MSELIFNRARVNEDRTGLDWPSQADRANRLLKRWVETKQTQNNRCADCCDKSPSWVNQDFGVFVCVSCAGAHRAWEFSVKSILLDDFSFERVERIIAKGGNLMVNRKLERCLPSWRKLRKGDSMVTRKRFVDDKYIALLFKDLNQALALDPNNKNVWELIRCLGKYVDLDFEDTEAYFKNITLTLGLVLEDALSCRAFNRAFLELFIRCGWDENLGEFKRPLSKSQLIKINSVITDRGYFFGAKKRRAQNDKQIQPTQRQEPVSRPSRPTTRPFRHTCGRPENREQSRFFVAEDEEKETTQSYYRVKIYGDDGLGLGFGEHRWGGVEITWVKPGMEGWVCGIRKGHVILEVNHEKVRNCSLGFVKELIEEGRPLTMRLVRPNRS